MHGRDVLESGPGLIGIWLLHSHSRFTDFGASGSRISGLWGSKIRL